MAISPNLLPFPLALISETCTPLAVMDLLELIASEEDIAALNVFFPENV